MVEEVVVAEIVAEVAEVVEEAVEEAVEEEVEEEVEVEEAAIQEELTILETLRKNKESYLQLSIKEAQKRPLTSLSKWPPTYDSTDKSTPLKKINGTSLSADFKKKQQDPEQSL